MTVSSELDLPFCGLYGEEEDEDDDWAMYEAMLSIMSDDDVYKFKHELRSIVSDQYISKNDYQAFADKADALRREAEGDKDRNKQEEAYKLYMIALAEMPLRDPTTAMRFILLLFDMNRIEESAGYTIAVKRATTNTKLFDKLSRFQLISTYAELGYAKKALEDAKKVKFEFFNPTPDDEEDKKKKKKKKGKVEDEEEDEQMNAYRAKYIENVQKSIDKAPQVRELDSYDFEMTLVRLLDPKQNENPALCSFLLYHLMQNFKNEKLSKKESRLTRLAKAGLFNDLTKVASLKNAFLRPDFQKWLMIECCLLVDFFDLANLGPKEMLEQNHADLFSQEIFQNFLWKFADGLLTNDGLKFVTHIGTTLHHDLISGWLQFLLEFVKKHPSFLKKSPFNQLNWHARLIFANLANFIYPNEVEVMGNTKRFMKRQSIDGYIDSCKLFELALQQDFFPVENDLKDVDESLNLLDMVLHMNWYLKQELLLVPEPEKITKMGPIVPIINKEGYSPKIMLSLYEKLLMKNSRSLFAISRCRPGLWVHLSQRIDYLAKNMAELTLHGILDLKISISLLVQMLEFEEGDNEMVIYHVESEDFIELVTKSVTKIITGKFDDRTELFHNKELLRNIRHLALRFVVAANRFCGEIPKKMVQPAGANIFSSFLELKRFDPVSAEFFYILLKIAQPVQLKPIEKHPDMNNFLAQLLALIYESRKREEISNICLCLTRIISLKNLVSSEVLMESILFSPFEEPQKLIAKLAGFIRPTRRARKAKMEETEAKPFEPIMPLCAGILLAALVRKDPVFRTALSEEDEIYGKVAEEFKKILEKAC